MSRFWDTLFSAVALVLMLTFALLCLALSGGEKVVGLLRRKP